MMYDVIVFLSKLSFFFSGFFIFFLIIYLPTYWLSMKNDKLMRMKIQKVMIYRKIQWGKLDEVRSSVN